MDLRQRPMYDRIVTCVIWVYCSYASATNSCLLKLIRAATARTVEAIRVQQNISQSVNPNDHV